MLKNEARNNPFLKVFADNDEVRLNDFIEQFYRYARDVYSENRLIEVYADTNKQLHKSMGLFLFESPGDSVTNTFYKITSGGFRLDHFLDRNGCVIRVRASDVQRGVRD